jgi:hypothetical protein
VAEVVVVEEKAVQPYAGFTPLKNNWQDNAGQYYNAAAMNAVANAVNALYDPNSPTGNNILRLTQVINGIATLLGIQGTDIIAFLQGGAQTSLPTAVSNQNAYVIKNVSDTIKKVFPQAGQFIDGVSEFLLNPGEAVTLISDGIDNWLKSASSFGKKVTTVSTASTLPASASTDVTAVLQPGAAPKLPAAPAAPGSTYVIKNATTSPIELSPQVGQLIEDVEDFVDKIVLQAGESIRLLSDGISKWFKL